MGTVHGNAVGWVRYMAVQSGGYGTRQCSRVGTVHGSTVGWVRYMTVVGWVRYTTVQSGGYGTRSMIQNATINLKPVNATTSRCLDDLIIYLRSFDLINHYKFVRVL